MVLVTRRHLQEAMDAYPDAATDLRAWAAIVSAARWKNMLDVAGTFKDADTVDGYTIFNVRHNRYRLVSVLHFSKVVGSTETRGHAYIRAFLTHKDYDRRSNWDKRFKR